MTSLSAFAWQILVVDRERYSNKDCKNSSESRTRAVYTIQSHKTPSPDNGYRHDNDQPS
jgi:hypothetical protein